MNLEWLKSVFHHIKFPDKNFFSIYENQYQIPTEVQVKHEHCKMLTEKFAPKINSSLAYFVNVSSVQKDTPLNRKKLSAQICNQDLKLEKKSFFSFSGNVVLVSAYKLEKEIEFFNTLIQLYSGYYSKSFIMFRDDISNVELKQFILPIEDRHGTIIDYKINLEGIQFWKDSKTEYLFTYGGFDFGSFISLHLKQTK